MQSHKIKVFPMIINCHNQFLTTWSLKFPLEQHSIEREVVHLRKNFTNIRYNGYMPWLKNMVTLVTMDISNSFRYVIL